MSRIKVNSITNKTEDGQVEFTRGIEIPVGKTFSVEGNFGVTGILTATSYIGNDINVSGAVNAASFSGDGSSLTGLIPLTGNKILAFKKILGFDEYRA